MVTAHLRKGWGETDMLSNTATGTSHQCSKRITTRKCNENMATFAKVRDKLLVAYDEGTIDDEEFILL